MAGGKTGGILSGRPSSTHQKTVMEGGCHALKRAAGLGYIPGAAVTIKTHAGSAGKRQCVLTADGGVAKAKTTTAGKGRRKNTAVLSLPSDCITKIAQALVASRNNHTVIILGMVNKQYHQVIAPDAALWYAMYMHWRGPPTPSRTVVSTGGRGMVRLLPSIPRTLPNFRDLGMSIS